MTRTAFLTILILLTLSCSRTSNNISPTGWSALGEPFDSLSRRLELGLIGEMQEDSINILAQMFDRAARSADAPANARCRAHYWNARAAGRLKQYDVMEKEYDLALQCASGEEREYLSHRIGWMREDMDSFSRIEWYRYLVKELNYYESVGDSVMMCARNLQLQHLMNDAGFKRRAITYMEAADRCCEAINRYTHFPGPVINKACMLYDEGDEQEAGEIFKRLLNDKIAMKDEAISALVYYNMYQIYKDSAALASADSIIRIHDYNNLSPVVTACLMELALKQGNLTKADSLASVAEKLDHLSIQSYHRMFTLNMIAKVRERCGDPQKAMTAYKMYAEEADSVLQSMRDNEVVSQEMQALINEADMKIEREKQEHNRNILWLVLGIAALISLAAILLHRRWKRLNMRRKEAELSKSESEQQRIAMQIASDKREQIIASTIDNLLKMQADGSVHSSDMSKLLRMLRENDTDGICSDSFQKLFTTIRPQFISRLLTQAPNLSEAAVRLACYSVIGMDTKEIASAMNVRPESVKQARWRLRKALGLPQGADLHRHLRSLLEE